MEQNQLQATISGTPQGGIISPLLANIAFHGMEDVLGITHHEKGGVKTESEYNLVKYADDFVVFSKSEDTINKAKSLIVTWLKERGLELSEEKTKISNIKEGFDFLGFNIRQYETAYKKRKKVLLIKPSKSSVLSFKKQMSILGICIRDPLTSAEIKRSRVQKSCNRVPAQIPKNAKKYGEALLS